jgi:hypothetical protein
VILDYMEMGFPGQFPVSTTKVRVGS